MEKIMGFLKKQVVASLTKMVGLVAKNLCAEQIDTLSIVVMIKAIKMALMLIPVEGLLGHLQTLVVCRYAEKGTEVPKEIEDLFVASVPTPNKSVAVTMPQLAPKPTLVPVTQATHALAPARELQQPTEEKAFNPEMGHRTWVGQLKSLLGDKNVPWPSLQGLTAKLLSVNFQFTKEDFSLLFSAMKVAQEKGQHIVNNKANPAKLFAAAPLEALDDLLFGQGGLVLAVTGEVTKSQSEMPSWLCAKCSIVLDAVFAADIDNRLSEQEADLVEKFVDAMENRNPPNWLLEKGREFGAGSPSQSVSFSNPVLAEKLIAAIAH